MLKKLFSGGLSWPCILLMLFYYWNSSKFTPRTFQINPVSRPVWPCRENAWGRHMTAALIYFFKVQILEILCTKCGLLDFICTKHFFSFWNNKQPTYVSFLCVSSKLLEGLLKLYACYIYADGAAGRVCNHLGNLGKTLTLCCLDLPRAASPLHSPLYLFALIVLLCTRAC